MKKRIICLVLAAVVGIASAFAFETAKYDNWDVNQYIVEEGKSDQEAVDMYIKLLEDMVFNKGYGVVGRVEAINFDDYETFDEAVEDLFGEDISSLGLTLYKINDTCFLSYDDPSTLRKGDILAQVGVTINGLMYVILVFPLESL